MGSLFAGPVEDTSLLLQWAPNASGHTLPIGGTPYKGEDHDSAAAAALGLGHHSGSSSSSSSKSRVGCVLFGAVPGRLWAGSADGRVHCWAVAGDGCAARLLHSWEAHSGKVKGIALSPCGRLFTGRQHGIGRAKGKPACQDEMDLCSTAALDAATGQRHHCRPSSGTPLL